MKWRDADLVKLRTILDSARGWHPSVLTIVGEPGLGKSSLLGKLRNLAQDFAILEAECLDMATTPPFDLLFKLGLFRTSIATVSVNPAVAAQECRKALDQSYEHKPVLLIVDDLQWADPESVEALYWLIRRASHDRIALAVATRPDGLGRHQVWASVASSDAATSMVRLRRLDAAQARDLIRQHDPDADDVTCDRVAKAVEGHPLYLQQLLLRYSARQLASMPIVPAPRDLTAAVTRRLQRVDPEALEFLYALAVLGHTWWEVALVAQIAKVRAPAAAVETLEAEELIERLENGSLGRVRIVHALVRSAIHASMESHPRAALHREAAGLLSDPLLKLEHLVAAVETYDDDLAEQLEQTALVKVDEEQFRIAAEVLRWSTSVTGDDMVRTGRWLESLYYDIVSRDYGGVASQKERIAASPDRVRGAMVLGALANTQKDWRTCVAILDNLPADLVLQADSRTQFRVLVQRLWAQTCLGASVSTLLPQLEQAKSQPAPDPSLVGRLHLIEGQIAIRLGDLESVKALTSSFPELPASTPLPRTFALAWRGVLYLVSGMGAEAERDMLVVTDRIRSGAVASSVTDGSFDAFLAWARWLSGSWALGRIDIENAIGSAVGTPHPATRGIHAMYLTVQGRLDEAEQQLEHMHQWLVAMPWWEMVQLYVVSRVTFAHARGRPEELREIYPDLLSSFPQLLRRIEGSVGALVSFHLALAATWASEFEIAKEYLRLLDEAPIIPSWLTWGRPWMFALIAEGQGTHDQAQKVIIEAERAGQSGPILLRANFLADVSRICRNPEKSRMAAKAALHLYAKLKAPLYVAKFQHDPVGQVGPKIGPLAHLTARERDVATLIGEGLNYQQIAEELYLSKSTVSFHLANIYAKTNTGTRHELSKLLHTTRNAG